MGGGVAGYTMVARATHCFPTQRDVQWAVLMVWALELFLPMLSTGAKGTPWYAVQVGSVVCTIEPLAGYDPATCKLQIYCSTNWATEAIWVGSDAFCLPRPRRCGMFQPRAYRDTIQLQRKGRVSNPRNFLKFGAFQVLWFKPLTHPSSSHLTKPNGVNALSKTTY